MIALLEKRRRSAPFRSPPVSNFIFLKIYFVLKYCNGLVLFIGVVEHFCFMVSVGELHFLFSSQAFSETKFYSRYLLAGTSLADHSTAPSLRSFHPS